MSYIRLKCLVLVVACANVLFVIKGVTRNGHNEIEENKNKTRNTILHLSSH